jgi:DNA mismatch repair protein MutS2
MQEPSAELTSPPPDLLHPIASRRIDGETAKLSIVMAFAGGTSGGLFAELLSRAPIAPSTFRPDAYVNDLFVKSFVSECFRIPIEGGAAPIATEHLLRLLVNPPADPTIVDFRRAIIWELMNDAALRKRTQHSYLSLCRFRTALEGSATPGGDDSNRRQLAILERFADAIETMANGFGGATSGLSRLAQFGSAVRASEGFRSLLELLSYDDKLATIDFRVGIGADGRVRSLQLLEVKESVDNSFVNPPWKRWAAKLELFGRGFSFGDGEVMARLLDAVFEGVRGHFVSLVQLTGDLEFYLGSLGLWDRAHAAGLEVCLPELVSPDQPRRVTGLFNPLLLSQGSPVPCDITTDRHDSTVLITGPNSGGKTRLLQALGLAQLLAQAGLFVPARSAQMALAPALVVSLIQETRVDQTEGRLGMELMRIRSLFESLPRGAMVLLDELCSGTNPSEGEEIFELVLQMLALLLPQAFITTHFLDFAGRLEQKRQIDGLRFLQVALGPRHEPTYQFAPGVAQTSLASQAAARLGVTGDQLLALIERNIAAAKGPTG